MARRVGLGPVFAVEWLMTARRWQAYAMRSLTVMLLLGAMTLIWYESPAGQFERPSDISIYQQAQVGKAFFGTTAMILLGLVGLAAPAATAGAVCLDKARGNLTLLFATDLSDAEIVLGKLAARLVPVLGMILCSAPVLAIATLFGGIDPVGLVGTLFVILACAIFGCALALTLSVWGKKTHEVLMATYVFGILYLLAGPMYWAVRSWFPTTWGATWLPTFEEIIRYNPVVLVIATIDAPPAMAPITIATQAAFLGLALAASALLIGVATWKIRTVVIRQLGQGERSSRSGAWGAWKLGWIDLDRIGRWAPGTVGLIRLARRAWPSPSLDRNPVLWRECQRKRPSRWNVAVWGVYVLLCGGFSAYAIALMIRGDLWGRTLGVMINCLQVASGLLLLSVSASTSLAEERQRGSLDVLLATPLPTRSIVWGKWWGAFRGVPPLLILPVAVSFGLSTYTGHVWGAALMAALIVAYGAAITSLGLALATWTARLGRAVGLTVGLYTFMCIGWIPLSFILFGDGPNNEGIGVAAGSPLMGVGVFSALLADEGPRNELFGQTLWTLFWAVAYGGVAVGLLLATLGTFNRCLGRIDDPSLIDEDDFEVDRTKKSADAIVLE